VRGRQVVAWAWRLWPAALALAIGTAGGLVFAVAGLPLPWMLGAMAATLVASLAGVPQGRPSVLVSPMRVILGVMIGSGFTPDVLSVLPEMLLSLVFVVPYVALLGLIGVPYLRRFAGYDLPTAYFASMPGGLADMTAFGKEMGGDEGKLALVHSTRVLIIVFLAPFVIELGETIDLSARARFGPRITDLPLRDVLVLLVCGLVGWWGAVKLRLTGATIVGPMILSAAVHLAGLTHAKPPDELIKLAQLVIGTAIGTAFVGVLLRDIIRIIVLTFGMVAAMLALTAAFAAAVHATTGFSLMSVILAYTPGGQAEMNLIALTRGVDVAYVAVHHMARVALVVVGAPILFRLLSR